MANDGRTRRSKREDHSLALAFGEWGTETGDQREGEWELIKILSEKSTPIHSKIPLF